MDKSVIIFRSVFFSERIFSDKIECSNLFSSSLLFVTATNV